MIYLKKFFIFFIFLNTSLISFAEDFSQKEHSNQIFELSLKKDAILLGSGILLSGSDLILDNILELNRKEYDNELYEKQNLNKLDKYFIHTYSEKKDSIANYTLAATMIAPSILLLNNKSQWLTDFTMYAETLLIANGIKELTKLCVNRARPYMYYDSSTFPQKDIYSGDYLNSFPSGHTTMAFSAATFTSYTFCKYFPDSLWKIPVVITSYGLATTTATLRILSGNHFLTDVLTGAILGSATGFFVPYLHKFNEKNDLNINLKANELSFSINF